MCVCVVVGSCDGGKYFLSDRDVGLPVPHTRTHNSEVAIKTALGGKLVWLDCTSVFLCVRTSVYVSAAVID